MFSLCCFGRFLCHFQIIYCKQANCFDAVNIYCSAVRLGGLVLRLFLQKVSASMQNISRAKFSVWLNIPPPHSHGSWIKFCEADGVYRRPGCRMFSASGWDRRAFVAEWAWELTPCRVREHHTVLFIEIWDIYVTDVYFRKRKDLKEAEYYKIHSSG